MVLWRVWCFDMLVARFCVFCLLYYDCGVALPVGSTCAVANDWFSLV